MSPENARIILNNHDLPRIHQWFKYHGDVLSILKNKIEALAYGAWEHDDTPESILAEIDRTRRKAAYIYLLSRETFEARRAHWLDSDPAALRSVTVEVEDIITSMRIAMERTKEIRTMVHDLILATDALTGRTGIDPIMGFVDN